MSVPDLFVEVVLRSGFANIVEYRRPVSDRLRFAPRPKPITEREHIRVRPYARISKQIPSSAGRLTFWDYRQLAFPKNRGMRIDLVYATPSIAGRVTDAYSDREARKGKSASDHAPVVVDLAD